MQSISTEGGVGGKVLLVREGCETDYYYAVGVGDGWLVKLLLDRTNYFNRFFD